MPRRVRAEAQACPALVFSLTYYHLSKFMLAGTFYHAREPWQYSNSYQIQSISNLSYLSNQLSAIHVDHPNISLTVLIFFPELGQRTTSQPCQSPLCQRPRDQLPPASRHQFLLGSEVLVKIKGLELSSQSIFVKTNAIKCFFDFSCLALTCTLFVVCQSFFSFLSHIFFLQMYSRSLSTLSRIND